MATTASELAGILPGFPVKELSAFHVESLLGGGGFSHVVLARDASGAEWALKLIPASNATCLDDVDSAPLLLSEARIHLLLSKEPSVLPCMEAFKAVYQDERGGGGAGRNSTFMAVLRMPVAACSVEDWLFSVAPLRPLCQGVQGCHGAPQYQVDEREVLGVWLQMVNAVHRCHSHGVVHKDIKLPNFLMDRRGKVQLMDFGLAHVDGVTPRMVVGTPWTMSPAGFKMGDDGRAGDWWSLGVVLYQLLQGGAWPFKHCWWPWQKGGGERMEAAIRRAVLAGRISFQDHGMGARVSEPVKALIRGLLQPDPNRRWQLRQVLASEAVGPELLRGIAMRFPELGADMEALLHIQRRARDVMALGNDGVAAPPAPSAPAAAAAAGAAAAGGLHWPLRPSAAKAGGGSGGGAGDGPYQPLLAADEEDEDGDGGRQRPRAAEAPRARRDSVLAQTPAAAAGAATAASIPKAGTPPAALVSAHAASPVLHPQQQQRQPQQQEPQPSAGGTAVEDLLLLLPDEVPRAHPSPPTTPRFGPPELQPRSRASGLSAGVGAVTTGSMRHAATTSSLLGDGDGRRETSGLHPSATTGALDQEADGSDSQPRPSSHRSLSGPQGGSQSPLGSASPMGGGPPIRASPRTSLADLFSGQGSGLVLGGPSLARPSQAHLHHHLHHLHHHNHNQQHQHRPTSVGGLGGLLGSAVDKIAGAAGHLGLHSRQPRFEALLQPGADSGDVRISSGSGFGAEDGLPALPQSSWVPPPPEVLAAGAPVGFFRRSEAIDVNAVGSPTRLSGGAAMPTSTAPQIGAGVRDSGDGGSGRGLHASLTPRRGLLSRARRLFSDCLLRPAVKYDSYDEDGYDSLRQG